MDFQNPISFYGDSPLHTAVRQDQVEDVREILIQQQIDVNILNSKQETPLHLACSKKDSPIVQLLVAFGADPFIKDSNNKNTYDRGGFDIGQLMTKLLFYHDFRLWIDGPIQADKGGPLHAAVRLGRVDSIRSLIEEKSVDINDTNVDNETPLHLACALGHKHIVHILISNGADLYKKDNFNNAPIHRAVSQGHIDTVEYLITDCACNPKIKGYQGRTLLHFACGVGNVKFATTLIEKYGISPMATDAINQTPLHIAASHGQEEVVRLLINKYNSLESTDLSMLLCLACYCGHVSVVKTLVLEYKADINEIIVFSSSVMGGSIEMVQLMITEFDQDPLLADDSGNTLLHIACWCGHKELARLLITKYNYSVNNMNKSKETPLQVACSFGHSSIVGMLISEFKADATQRDDSNDTAISKAARGGHVETVQILITELGCSPKITGYDGGSLLHEACRNGSIKLAEMLIINFSLDALSADDSGNTPLHMACWCGHMELARLLITKYNCLVDVKNEKNETPLHKACLSGHSSIVRMLISEYKADVTQRDHNNDTAVSKAVIVGHMETVQALLTELGCSPEVTGFKGGSLLHAACLSGNIKLAEMLIIDFSLDMVSVDDSGNTPLHLACWCGHEELARLLITKYNCPVDVMNEYKETPLHNACLSGHNSIVRMLVCEFEADVTQRDHNNDTAVSIAAEGGHVETVQILITELGCSPKITGYDGRSLLHEACQNGSIKLANMLIIDFSLDTLSADDSGNTPLHMACSGGNEELARLLITKYNCFVDIKNEKNETPLHKACSSGHSSIVRMLISEFEADVTQRDHNNDTAVSIAAEGGHVETVQALIIELGCSPKITGYDGRSLLHEACQNGSIKLANMLIIDFSLDTLSADDSGNTPLHMACSGGHEELARLLITKYNCPVDVMNEDKETPLHNACLSGHNSIVRMLVSEFEADVTQRDHNNDTAVSIAAEGGYVETVQALITELGCSPKITGYDGRSLLHEACQNGSIKLANMLIIDFSLDTLSADDSGNTPLHMACSGGHEELARLLITKYNCHVNVKNRYKQTPLHMACSRGHLNVSKVLISESMLRSDKRFYNALDMFSNTPLDLLIKKGDAKAVYILSTEYHLRLHVRGAESKPLLHQLAAGGYTTILKELILKFNYDPACTDEDGNTILHTAAHHGQYEIAKLLIAGYSNQCPIDYRNSQGKTALHCACISGHTRVAKLLDANNADITIRDEEGDTPLKKAFLAGHELTLFELIRSDLRTIDIKLLQQVCKCGSVDLIDVLLSDFHLDPSSLLDHQGNQAIHIAALGGHMEVIVLLVKKYKCPIDSRGFKKRSLLHLALAMGHTSTAKTLIEVFHLSLHCVDKDGNTPLHLSSLVGRLKSVRFLLYEYHAPVHVRNKAGKTALDLAMKDSATKKVIREYINSEHIRIQHEYEGLQAKSKQKYSGQQVITRVFVLGNPESGKSTLVESLKRKGIISSLFTVTEADVPPHTAGIVPSVHQSKETGRLLYYDFAGDQEYYSSHGAILEMVSHSTVGSNVFLIVADLTKDDAILQDEIGYWLSFISYHGKALDSQSKLKVIIVLSHLDHMSVANSNSKVESARQYLQTHINQSNDSEVKFDAEIISSNCRSPRSSRSVASILQQISKDTLPCSISYEASLLHGLLENDFGNVVACTFQNLLSSIEETGIYLPSSANALHPIVRELHDIGLLMLIGRSEDELENHLLLLNTSSLTNEVHEKLFSNSAFKKLRSPGGPHFASIGILPESYLASILPEHITKECLVQLQYCQEFTCADIERHPSKVSKSISARNLLYFPALCELDREQSNWPTDPLLNFSIGWYAKCTGKFDYFPARFLHVLLLRLAFALALPNAHCKITESNEISSHNRRCTMWKNGIRWLMEEGVECIFEMVNDNKGIVVITKSEGGSKEWSSILSKIIIKTLQAKAEFCSTVSLYHFLLKSDDIASFKNEDKLFEISEIESVIKDGEKKVVSVSGRTFLDSSHLDIFKKYTFGGKR